MNTPLFAAAGGVGGREGPEPRSAPGERAASDREAFPRHLDDDGATWQRSELDRDGSGWRTALHAPESAGFVTLRVTARDAAGNSVSQTITRAFGLR
ncbi:hypothetical protein [Streptomyces sp. NPDC059460]|uniref:hypothetical protein n=1 Tax=Streptomyces sp. NPDC059460 TaxID=3346840 RepID=UPI0036836ADD